MTAEVAILNREAVAMAADSALTLGGPVGKVYNSANKLFALSRLEPVAVMVYGGGSFEGIPWATVVKEHRRRLAAGAFDTIEDYASDFIAHLSSLVSHMPTELQQERVLMRVSWELLRLRDAAEAKASGDHPGDDQILIDLIESRIHQLEEDGGENGPGEASAAQAFDDAVDDWNALLGELLQGYRVTDTVTARVLTIAEIPHFRSLRFPTP